MKLSILLLVLVLFYLRKPVFLIWKNHQINRFIRLIRKLPEQDKVQREKTINYLIENRLLLNELINNMFFYAPSFNNRDPDVIVNTYHELLESKYSNQYWIKKRLFNVKYFLKDLFFIPASVLSFLSERNYKKPFLILFSVVGWLLTFFVSVYSQEVKTFIDLLIRKVLN